MTAAAGLAMVMLMPGSSRAATLAATPYMGWNTYYGLGPNFDEATIKSVANSLISTGLAKAGYDIVWLDASWATGKRSSDGQLVVDSAKWPDGMAGLTGWLHSKGLLAGIYTDAGSTGCNKKGVGSYGHYQQDANTFAAWGFDAVKVDFCGAGEEGRNPRALYPQIASALRNNASHRPMILNVCNFWTPGQVNGTNPSLANSSWDNYQWAPAISNSWRTDTDVGFTGSVAFSDVVRNLDQDATHPEAAGPGHWNDPDYLGPGLGMTDTEARSQFSMWAMLAAPLILGSDPRKLSQAEIDMLENPQVIAIDQDSFGAQATLAGQSGSDQVWVKPLADGDTAVALFNRGDSASTITTSASELGLAPAGAGYTLRDVWANTTTTTSDQISALVQPHEVVLYRVTPGGDGSLSVGASYPIVTAQKPAAVSGIGATLNGTVYPDDNDTLYSFQYGTSTSSYANATAPVDAGSGTAAVAARTSLTGLHPKTTYHYRLCAGHSASGGALTVLTCGEDQHFTTPGPVADTIRAGDISETGAVLNGTVNPNGAATTYHFEYSTDHLLNSGVVDAPAPDASAGSGISPKPESVLLNGLRPNTTYYFRIVVSNAKPPVEGQIASFRTLPLAPAAVTGRASEVKATAAMLHGSVDPNGTTVAYRFEYSDDRSLRRGAVDAPARDAFGGQGSSAQRESQVIRGLRPATTYYYRIIATSAGGTADGTVKRFTTAPALHGFSIGPSSFSALSFGATIERATRATREHDPQSGGTRIAYRDSAAARTRFIILKLVKGVRKGKRCVSLSPRRARRGRSCIKAAVEGSFTHADKRGRNSFRFTGRVRGHALEPGSYLIKAIARDRAGRSVPVIASFTILG